MSVYWDSSAVVAALVEEAHTETILGFVNELEGRRPYTSVLSFLEIESALQLKLLDRKISAKHLNDTRQRLVSFRKMSSLIVTDQIVLDTALHIQRIHHLRVADSVQLASARVGVDDPSQTLFLSFDHRLNEAAQREGFIVAFSSSSRD